jgi:hypothetical protein
VVFIRAEFRLRCVTQPDEEAAPLNRLGIVSCPRASASEIMCCPSSRERLTQVRQKM